MTRSISRAAGWLCTFALLSSGALHAQVNLTSFVNDPTNGATALQRETGIAMQGACGALAGANRTSAQQQDLFSRCNELVETAKELQNVTNPGEIDRSLGLTTSGLLGAIQQVSGEELAAPGVLTTQVSSGQFTNIAGRLNALRFGTSSGAVRGRVASASYDAVIDLDHFTSSQNNGGGRLFKTSSLRQADAQDATSADSGSSGAAASPWGWFMDGSYNLGDRDRSANEDGFDFDAASVTLGADYNFGNAVLGASLGYDRYSADFDANGVAVSGGDVKVKGASGSLFGAWYGERLSFNAIASYGSPDSDVKRLVTYTPADSDCADCTVQNRTLIGSPDGRYVAAGATLGYDAKAGSWDFAPSLSVSYRDVNIDGYRESDSVSGGGLALQYDEQSIESLRSILGFALSKPFSRGFGILTPSLRLEWHHEFKDEARTLRAKYAVETTLPGVPDTFGAGCISCFNFASDSPDKDFGVVGAGMSFVFTNRLQAYVYAESLVGAANLTSYSIAFGLRRQF